MSTSSDHPSYPWPPGVRRWLWSSLAGAGVTLLVAFAPMIGAGLGFGLAQGAIDRWLAIVVPIAVMLIGVASGAIASGIVGVNRGRDGRTRRFLLPSRAGVIETASPTVLVLFIATSSAFAVLFSVAGAVLTLRALL